MNISFETATQADIPVIFSQAKALIVAYEDTGAIDYGRVMAWVERKITQHISEYRCVIADGEKCAYWRLCPDGELDDVYVLPAFRSKGIGSLILETCIKESRQNLYLYVFTKNVRAVSFYKRFGFEVHEAVGETRCIIERKG